MARWWGERCRAAASPGAVRALMEMNSRIDVREACSAVHVPTLVVHRGADFRVAEEGRYIAQRIPGARLVELDGADHFPAIDPDQILDAVEPFVRQISGAAPASAPAPDDDRVLATVLFVDVVGSTGAAKPRRRAWARLLARHYAVVRASSSASRRGDRHRRRWHLRRLRRAGARRPLRTVDHGALRRRSRRPRRRPHRRGRPRDGAPRGIAVHTAARVAGAAAPGEVLRHRDDLRPRRGLGPDVRRSRGVRAARIRGQAAPLRGHLTVQRAARLFDAPGRIRTSDPRIRSPPLCPLSYGRMVVG